MKKIVIQLDDLVCPMCSSKIEKGLKKNKGIIEVNVSYNSSKAKVSFDENIISQERILDIIDDLGYDIISVK